MIRRVIEKEQTHPLHSSSISDGKKTKSARESETCGPSGNEVYKKVYAIIPENVHSLTFCQSELYLIMELENFTKSYM